MSHGKNELGPTGVRVSPRQTGTARPANITFGCLLPLAARLGDGLRGLRASSRRSLEVWLATRTMRCQRSIRWTWSAPSCASRRKTPRRSVRKHQGRGRASRTIRRTKTPSNRCQDRPAVAGVLALDELASNTAIRRHHHHTESGGRHTICHDLIRESPRIRRIVLPWRALPAGISVTVRTRR